MMLSFRRPALLATSALAALAAPTIAHAEDEAQNSERAIIVTGQRETPLTVEASTSSRLGITPLETPASVSTLDGDEIRARGDFQFIDAVTRAPGITASASPGNGNSALSSRGFTGHGSVMHLFNGVRQLPTAGTISFPFDSWNVERIEVLTGPASVLFGQGAMGGVVNAIPKMPSFDGWRADGIASFGSFETLHLAAGLGGPITPDLGIRADASYRQSDGYVDRGDSRSLALSGALEWRPVEGLSVVLRHDLGDNEPMQYWGTPLANGVLDPAIRRENYNVGDAVIDWRDNRTQLSIDWAANDTVSISSTTFRLATLRRWENLENYSYNAAAQTVSRSGNLGIVHDAVQWGNQTFATFATPLGGGLRNTLVAGIDFNWIELEYSHNFASAPQNDTVPATGFNPGTLLDTVGILPRYRTDTRTMAGYLENRLEIGPRFSIIAGLRYEEDKVGRWNFTYDPTGTRITGETPALAGGTEAYKQFTDFTWRVGAVYEVSPNVSLFGQYVTGVDPVGTLTTFTPAANQFAFTNASGNMVEAGVKALLPNGTGFVTLAAYRIVKNDLTVQQVTNGPLEQIGQQSSTGVEAALALNLPFGLGLDANATLLDAEFEFFRTPTVDFSGNTPPNVPEASANLSVRWDVFEQLQLRSNWRWVGRRYSNNANTLEIPAYSVVDLSASLALSDHVAIDARVGNVFDEDYAIASYGATQWLLGRPRSYDVAVRFAF